MFYHDALEYLASLQMFGMRPGLENAGWLAGACGNPQHQLRFIHVAGTNGKGSVCAMLEAFHRHAGRRVGLYTSPHLVSFTERIQINRQPIPPESVARWTAEIQRLTQDSGRELTFFEAVTGLALAYFAEENCDVVVWETGLGGRLDATNIVTPLASVITNIDLDHQQWLGETVEQIAVEKSGIIKPGRPVITGATAGRGLEVIARTAIQAGCPLTVVGANSAATLRFPGQPTVQWLVETEAWTRAAGGDAGPFPEPNLRGRHQRTNAALALATVAALAAVLPVPSAALRQGLTTVAWPGRLQSIALPGGRTLVLDGAHNPAGARALRDAMSVSFPGVRPAVVMGLLADKDWESVVQVLVPLAARILAVPVNSRRTLDPARLLEACQKTSPQTPATACATLPDALALAQQSAEAFILLTGSLYLVGEALELLGAVPIPELGERGLNEWTPDRAARASPP